MNLSSVQQRAVDELLEYFKESYYNDNINKIIEFKAPTGSGKTFMISNFIDKASIYHHDLNQDWKIILLLLHFHLQNYQFKWKIILMNI